MSKQLNNITKREMRIVLNSFLQYDVYLSKDDIKMIKIFKYDDITYEINKYYAIDYIKCLITTVTVNKQGYNWKQLFEDELEKLSKYSLTLSNKRNEVDVFSIIEYMLNSFIDYIYEVVLTI